MEHKTDHDLLVEAVTILRGVDKRVEDQGRRLRALELKYARFKGWIAGASAASSAAGAGATIAALRLLGH